jgi:lipopolysaccharide transport system ATP-binding protein
MSEPVIAVDGLSKRYVVYDSPRARLLDALCRGCERRAAEVWALREVSFAVAPGEAVAVIGRNGSGKTTLLEILARTLAPTAGRVAVRGRVSALLELGSGFSPRYTGRENVVLNGLLLGLSRREIHRRFDEIAAFAEIGDAIDRPVRTYSSGMAMRLSFAVQALLEPDILIVDEALGVGDLFFQQKCFAHLRRLRERGTSLLLVSHDMSTVRDVCQRALYLRAGRAAFFGDAGDAIRMLREDGAPAAPICAAPGGGATRAGAMWARGPDEPGLLRAVYVFDGAGAPVDAAPLGSRVRVRAEFAAPRGGAPRWVSLGFKNRFDHVVAGTSSRRLGIDDVSTDGVVAFEFEVDLMLEGGAYALRVAAGRQTSERQGVEDDATGWIGPLAVTWNYAAADSPFVGMFGLPTQGRLVDRLEVKAEPPVTTADGHAPT